MTHQNEEFSSEQFRAQGEVHEKYKPAATVIRRADSMSLRPKRKAEVGSFKHNLGEQINT